MSTESATQKTSSHPLYRYVPILSWLPHYKVEWLSKDLVAGFTTWGVVFPAGVAYAGMAGVPAQAGLYTLLASLTLYAILGTSKQLVLASTSASAIMIGSEIAALNPSNATAYYELVTMLVVLTGAIFFLCGLFKLGFITNFFSHPVMAGFISGLVIYTVVAQLPKLLGMMKGTGNTFQQLWYVLTHLNTANLATVLVGLVSLIILFVLPLISRRIPSGLVVLVLGILVSKALNLNTNYGVAIVGTVPAGLPPVTVPQFTLSNVEALLPSAIGLMLVMFSEAAGAADFFATKYGYEVDSNQEMVAMGVASIASGFIGGLAAGGSVSQSSINDEAGARTPVSLLVAAALVLFTVLVLTPLFTDLPNTVLAALIIHAVIGMLKIKQMRRYFQLQRLEFWLGMVTLMGVLLIDVLPGLIIGMVFSLLVVIYRSSRPSNSVLGQVPGAFGTYGDIKRHPENTTIPGLLIFRPDATMYFPNANEVRDHIRALVKTSKTPVRTVLIDMTANDELDITSVEMLENLAEQLHNEAIELLLAEVHEPVKEMVERSGLLKKIGTEQIFPTVDAAVQHFRT